MMNQKESPLMIKLQARYMKTKTKNKGPLRNNHKKEQKQKKKKKKSKSIGKHNTYHGPLSQK